MSQSIKKYFFRKRNIHIHSNAICETIQIGAGTRIWAFSHVQADVVIGENCNIGEGVFIENGVKVGDCVTVKNGVQLWQGLIVEDFVFIGPNATFANDKYPKSRNANFTLQETLLKKNCSIGANATILPGIVIGEGAVIGAGAVVTKSVEAGKIVVGNPAQILD